MLLVLAILCVSVTGCKSTVDDVNIKDVYGPAGRHAKNLVEQAKRETSGDPVAGLEEYNAARKIYDEQNYVAARKAFKAIVKKYKKKSEPIEEDAMFYVAECDFQLGRYPAAQDGYDELLKKYPSTKYLEQSVRRWYAIARYWLNSPKPASEIELTSFQEENGEERLNELREAHDSGQPRLKPNFTDKTRPFFDTPGRALQALRSVYLHDVSGPLAPEALMAQAMYYFRKRDYLEADHAFSQIRESYGQSKYVQAAYVLGAHASYKSYLGSRYDGKQLEEAQKLTKNALRLFPDIPQRPKLENDLKKMDAELIEREWQRVVYYKKRREKDSVAVYCEWIVEKYPDSPQAAKARDILIELGPEHSARILSTPLVKTDPVKPNEPEPPYNEPEEPARLRLLDSDKDAKPIPPP
jgi:outer membrane protein assembly factor BamD (BamD/ComL family)